MAEAGQGGTRTRRTRAAPRSAAEAGAPPSSTDTAGDGGEVATDRQPPLCSIAFCPICSFVTTVSDARPELVEHLVLASREVLLAVRALIDARLEGMPPPSSKLERLTIG
jgi:hypothetical protein